MEKISKIIAERGLKPADVGYHTMRLLENGGKIRALLVKGETTTHVEYVCPKCGHYAYLTQPWQDAGKAKVRFSIKCAKCGSEIKVEKLKGKRK
jgi:peptide subunit release factor 1 (eRF1)